MDITPLVPKGRQLINGYGDGGFRISGVRYEGSVWVLPEVTLAWSATDIDQDIDRSLQELIEKAARRVEILLLGMGRTMLPIPKSLRQRCRDAGVALETMDTGAACRTYNVLLTEERGVAAALIAIGSSI